MSLFDQARTEIEAIWKVNPELIAHGLLFLYSPVESFNPRASIVVLGHNPVPASLAFGRLQYSLTREQRSNLFFSGVSFDGVEDIDFLWIIGSLFSELVSGASAWPLPPRDSLQGRRYGFQVGWRLLHTSVVSNISPFASYNFPELAARSRGELHWDRLWGKLLPRIRPRLVITLGAEAFHCVKRIYGVGWHHERPRNQPRKYRVWPVAGGPLLIGFDHPRPPLTRARGGDRPGRRFEEEWMENVRYAVDVEDLTRRFVDPQIGDLMDRNFFDRFS